MAHRINLSRTPVNLQTPYYQRMLAQAPACTPAVKPLSHGMRGWRAGDEPIIGTDAQVAADLDLAFARLISE